MKDGHELNDSSKSWLLACHALAPHTNATASRGQVGPSAGPRCAASPLVEQTHSYHNGEARRGGAEQREWDRVDGEEEGGRDKGRGGRGKG